MRHLGIPDNTSFAISLSLSVVPQSNRFTIHKGLPHAARKYWCSNHICFLKERKNNISKVYLGYWSCRKQWQYLDFAKYASYKQVGFLVHIQDGVGGGWVSTGWARHHTCHRSFQRIHWNGAIQPISVTKESLMLLSYIICGRRLQRVDMLEPGAVFLPSWLWMSSAMLQTGCMHNANVWFCCYKKQE